MKKLFVVLAIMLFSCWGLTFPQVLHSENGSMNNLTANITYTLDPNPNSAQPIIPSDNSEFGTPIKFTLRSIPGSRWRISFNLPSTLKGNYYFSDQPVNCSFNDTSAFYEEEQKFWNPHNTNIITTDTSGTMHFYLGMTILIPSVPCVSEYNGNVLCTAQNLDTSLTLIDSAQYSTALISNWGLLFPTGHLWDLSRGQTYTLNVESHEVYPILTGKEKGEVLSYSYNCLEPGAKLSITFNLPTSLFNVLGDSIPCSFSSQSAYDKEMGTKWNPHNGYIFTTSNSGSVKFDLGITVSVPESAHVGDYVATIPFVLTYVGNKINAKQAVEDLEFDIRVTDFDIPKKYSLYQNYPNPFNAFTIIRYDLPEPVTTSLKVYDLLCREISTLVSGFKHAGEQSIEWNASNLPSGVYYYRLQVGSYIETKKLILMK
jgi:hypothetical protein